MLRLLQRLFAAWRSREWFGPKRQPSPTRDTELQAAARRERQRLENRLHATES